MRLRPIVVLIACIVGTISYLAYTRLTHAPDNQAPNARMQAAGSGASLAQTASTGVNSVNHSAPQHMERSGGAEKSPDRWYKLYKSAPDRFTFVSQAARAALNGDGRAAVYVGDAVYDCLYDMHQAAHGIDLAVAHQRELEQLAQNGSPGWVSEVRAEHFERCKKLATTDAFTGLPARDGGYADPRYWWDLATQSKDPGALTRDAVEKLSIASDGTRRASMDPIQAQDAINRALLSADPMAMFSIGYALSDAHLSTNTDHGMAIALAGCDLGYDCSWDNPAMRATACKYNDACQGYTDFPSYLAASLGPDKYAKVYAEAQELKTYLTNQSTDEALAFAKIYRPPPSKPGG